MKKLLFSIIIPVYNKEAFLKECLDSVLSQTYSWYEAICINDGSSDCSGDILADYGSRDKRFSILTTENRGVSAARNLGIKAAKGEYLLFLDGDDVLESFTLEHIYKLIMSVSTKMKEGICEGKALGAGADIEMAADAVVFGCKAFPAVPEVDNRLRVKPMVNMSFTPADMLTVSGIVPYVCGKVYRRDILESNRILFDEELALGEDQLFQFQYMPFVKRVIFDDKILYRYRQNVAGSAMTVNRAATPEKTALHLKQADKIIRLWREYGLLPQLEEGLCIWMFEFLYPDMILYMDAGHRRQQAKSLRSFMKSLHLTKYFFRLSFEKKKWYIRLLLGV